MLMKATIVPGRTASHPLEHLSPGPAQKRLAFAVRDWDSGRLCPDHGGLLSGYRRCRVDAFLPAYLSAMFVCDSITAILLSSPSSQFCARARHSSSPADICSRRYPDSVSPDFSRRVCAHRGLFGGCRVPQRSMFCGTVVFRSSSSATPFQRIGSSSKRLWSGTFACGHFPECHADSASCPGSRGRLHSRDPLLPQIMLDASASALQWP
jgi:hypothetical protein